MSDLKSGRPVSLDARQQKVLVIIFLSAECPCSRAHEEHLAELARAYPEVQFVGVHSNKYEDPIVVREHFLKSSIPFPVVSDREQVVADHLAAFKTPHVFVVGTNGECWFRGGVDDSKDSVRARNFFLKRALADLRAGREPEIKEARVLGCVIQR